jgi:hypothetical protein
MAALLTTATVVRSVSDEPEVLYPADLDYAGCVERVAAEMRARSLVPLLGAGVSVSWPACLPAARKLLAPLIKLVVDAVEHPLSPYRRGSTEHIAVIGQICRARLERVLGAFHQIYGDSAMDWLSQLESENCNDNHLALAALVRAGFLPHIITLNFDCLIEEAIERLGGRCVTRCTLHPASFETGEGSMSCIVTKPHGSLFPGTNERFRYLGATLGQVGMHVSALTLRAFSKIFRMHPAVFVAGYSDNDWDIMPAIMDPEAGAQRVIWVQHSSVPPEHAMAWLRHIDSDGSGHNAIAVRGNVTRLLQDCVTALGAGPPPKPESRHALVTRDAGRVFGNRTKNALVFAYLLHDDEVKQHLLEKLGVLAAPAEEALRLSGLASVAHTQRQLARALRLNRRAFRLRAAARNTAVDELAGRILWIGYEHLCLCKRLQWRLVLAPWHLYRGRVLLRRGVRAGQRTTRLHREALDEYYRADLIHSWANVLIAGGPRVVARFRCVFEGLVRRYCRVDALDPELMAGEYYWLRKLEARLLAGEAVDVAKERGKILEILEAYEQIQNSVQRGNPYVYLALLEFLHGSGIKTAAMHLDKAEEIWRKLGNVTPAGLDRVAVYRRFCGIKTCKPALACHSENANQR